MKFLRLLPFAAVFALVLPVECRADLLFREDFEGSAYTPDLPIPIDFGVIGHGKWNPVPKEARPGVVVQDGDNHVLELKAVSGFDRGSRAIALLGRTNDAATVTDEALRFRFRFKMTAPLGDGFYIQLGGTDGKSKAVLAMDESGTLLASFGGERTSLGNILESHHWYTVEVLLPAKPQTRSVYTVHLYDGDVEIGRAKGRMARSMETDGANYRSLDFQHGQPGEALYIDDIVVETLAGGGE